MGKRGGSRGSAPTKGYLQQEITIPESYKEMYPIKFGSESIKVMTKWGETYGEDKEYGIMVKRYTGGRYLSIFHSHYPKGMDYALDNPKKFEEYVRGMDEVLNKSYDEKISPQEESKRWAKSKYGEEAIEAYSFSKARMFGYDYYDMVMSPKNKQIVYNYDYRQFARMYLREYAELNKKISETKQPENVMVWRGNGDYAPTIVEKGVGTQFHVPKLISGSLSYGHAGGFDTYKWRQAILLKKGSPVVNAEGLIYNSLDKPNGYKSMAGAGEAEIIFPLKTKFEVLNIDYKNKIFYTKPLFDEVINYAKEKQKTKY